MEFQSHDQGPPQLCQEMGHFKRTDNEVGKAKPGGRSGSPRWWVQVISLRALGHGGSVLRAPVFNVHFAQCLTLTSHLNMIFLLC